MNDYYYFFFNFDEIENVGGSSSVSADRERTAAIHFLLHLPSSQGEKKRTISVRARERIIFPLSPPKRGIPKDHRASFTMRLSVCVFVFPLSSCRLCRGLSLKLATLPLIRPAVAETGPPSVHPLLCPV